MDNRSKAYSIILYLIWPFSAVLIGFKNFDSAFGRKLLIAAYAFLGFTAISFGDLERYEAWFYELSNESVSIIFASLLNLQIGKFYNQILSVFVAIFFNSHHFYFLILFLIYGFFVIKIIDLFKDQPLVKLNKFGILFFIGLVSFFLLRNIPNLAFYTGGLFVIYNALKYYKTKSRKFLLFILFAPLFHVGLSLFILLPPALIFFNNKTALYVLFVVLTLGLGQTKVVEFVGEIASEYSGTIVETKYKAYASEKGQEFLEQRNLENAVGYNIKLVIYNYIHKSISFFFVPLGLIILYFKRNTLLNQNDLIKLFQITLLFWGISNIMLNIAEGERFLNIYCFVAIGLFFKVYNLTNLSNRGDAFSLFLNAFVPILFIFGIMAIIASHFIIPIQFYISNFFVEIYNSSFS